MNPRMWSAVGLTAAFLVIVGVAAAAAPVVRVPADAGWVSTGVSVAAGTTYDVKAVGQAITANAAAFAPVRGGFGAVSGAEGQPWHCVTAPGTTCFLSDAPFGALVGKVGPNGSPFFVGDGTSFVAPAGGDLYFAVNDFFDDPLFLTDNNGGFTVFLSPQNG